MYNATGSVPNSRGLYPISGAGICSDPVLSNCKKEKYHKKSYGDAVSLVEIALSKPNLPDQVGALSDLSQL
jgi:hypothetical protein